MPILTGPLDALALVLLAAGIAKLAAPEATAPALRSVGAPAPELLARAIGGAEIVVGAVVLAFGGVVPAVLAAVLYAGFTAFSLLLLRSSGAKASCGCFGEASAPITNLHVVVNAAAAAVAAAAVVFPIASVPDAVRELGWDAPAFVLLVGVLAGLVRAALTVGTRLEVAMRELRGAA